MAVTADVKDHRHSHLVLASAHRTFPPSCADQASVHGRATATGWRPSFVTVSGPPMVNMGMAQVAPIHVTEWTEADGLLQYQLRVPNFVLALFR